jgi:hypothetical protein
VEWARASIPSLQGLGTEQPHSWNVADEQRLITTIISIDRFVSQPQEPIGASVMIDVTDQYYFQAEG